MQFICYPVIEGKAENRGWKREKIKEFLGDVCEVGGKRGALGNKNRTLFGKE